MIYQGYALTPVSSAGGYPWGQGVSSCPSREGSAFHGEEGAFLVTFLAAWLLKKLKIIVKNIFICLGRVQSVVKVSELVYPIQVVYL